MRNRIIIIALAVLATAASCKSEYETILQSNDIQAKYKMAFELFDAGKYVKAAETFESVSLGTKGTAQDDTVQFYWGLSNYRFGDYQTAESNLAQFIATFPLSPFTEQAQYLRISCLYKMTYRYELDQTPTYKALTEMNIFQIENPNSEYHDEVAKMSDNLHERLDMKAYKSAYLYYHMEDYLAAHYALRNVLKDNADNRYREDVLYYTAMAAYKYAYNSVPDKQHERYLTFVDDYFNVVSEYPESKYRKELDSLYGKVQKILKKDSTSNDN